MKVGITGGIGSGKTTICKIFETLGIPVYYSDQEAKRLMVESESLKANIIELLGKDAYLESGQLNREHVAGIVFNNKEKLQQLNALVHPAVHQDADKWSASHKNAPYTLREAALIFESGGEKYLDKTITVFTPKEVRIQRVMKRDNATRTAVEARIQQQMSEEEKMQHADFVIINDGLHGLIGQVMDIHEQLLAMKMHPIP